MGDDDDILGQIVDTTNRSRLRPCDLTVAVGRQGLGMLFSKQSPENNLVKEMGALRTHLREHLGVHLPGVLLMDDLKLAQNAVSVRLQGLQLGLIAFAPKFLWVSPIKGNLPDWVKDEGLEAPGGYWVPESLRSRSLESGLKVRTPAAYLAREIWDSYWKHALA